MFDRPAMHIVFNTFKGHDALKKLQWFEIHFNDSILHRPVTPFIFSTLSMIPCCVLLRHPEF